MASLLRPQVPGVTSIGNVLAQATQNAAIQSRTILAAASAIARQRQQDGALAADAIVRRRMERFQREQFEQKRRVENQRLQFEYERLGIAKDANRRAEVRAPLENDVLRESLKDAPVRRALLGAQVTGTNLRNAASALDLEALPQRLKNEAEMSAINLDLSKSQAALGVFNANQQLKDSQEAEATSLQIQDILKGYDGTPHTAFGVATQLKALRESDAQLKNPEVLNEFNAAVKMLNLPDKVSDTLIIPDPRNDLQPGTQISYKLPDGTSITKYAPLTKSGSSSSSTAERSANRLEVAERLRAIKENRDSKVATMDKRIDLNAKILASSQSKEVKKRAQAELNAALEQKEAAEAEFRAETQKEMENIRSTVPTVVADDESEIDPILVDDDYPNFINEVLGQVYGGDPTQKKTSSISEPPAPAAPEKPLPPNERKEGEFRIMSGTMVDSEDANDGDSFLFKGPSGKTEHFRLYFADTPETSYKYLSKVGRQGKYFGGISDKDVVKVGNIAKEKTKAWMKNEQYELITRDERIMNSQRNHAMIFFPNAPLGERWLAERLVRNGLAMVSARGSKLPDGTTAEEFRERLAEAEKVARVNRLGAWAFTKQ